MRTIEPKIRRDERSKKPAGTPGYLASIFLALVTTVCCSAAAQTALNVTAGISLETDWREDYAYIVGMQAYIYGYPALRYTRDRYYMVEKPSGIVQIRVNEFFHVSRLADSSDKYSNSPNNDTIYSLSWIDLTDEPVVMHAPQGDGRYVDIELADFYSDVFGYVSPHMHDGKALTCLITGPDWDGPIPEGEFDGVLQAPPPCVWTVARVFPSGGYDLAIAK